MIMAWPTGFHAIEHEKHKHRNEANDHNNDAVLLSSKSISKILRLDKSLDAT